MNDPNLVITGMMGTGKSSVARLLSKKLGRPFVDTDAELEKRFGKSIRSIFAKDGESAFRTAEFELCKELSQKQGLVISTGGGSLLTRRSLRLFDGAEVFCLDASAQTIIERTSRNSRRPLLSTAHTSTEPSQRIYDLLAERQSAYDAVFHHVNVEGHTKEHIVQTILQRYTIGKNTLAHRLFLRVPYAQAQTHVTADGLAFEIPAYLDWAGLSSRRIFIISDDQVKSLYADNISKSFVDALKDFHWISFPSSEQHKTLETVHSLYNSLLNECVKRDDVIVALGGGVVGDIAGYVAATYMRGLTLIQVPTTLLSMIDSSIGGKTGVDLPQGKNLVGAFKQPRMILVDPQFLKTLSKEELISGMAEIIKHAMIGDAALFKELENTEVTFDANLLKRAAAVKMRIVEEDPFESDRRALLNLGHTFGHAIEKVSNYQIRHGYAVALGLVAACDMSFRGGYTQVSLRERVVSLLKKYGLPTTLAVGDAPSILDAMRHDKKAGTENLKFILPIELGDIRNISVNDSVLIQTTINSLIGK